MLSAWAKESITLNKRGRLLQNRGKSHTHNKWGKLSYFGRKLKTLIVEEQIMTLIREEQIMTLIREEQIKTLIREEPIMTLIREEQHR